MPREIHPDTVRRILDARLLLEANLTSEYAVKTLAATAKMSPFHFQRTFRRVVGESVANHVRRLRLERASLVLRNSETPVTNIALDSGFDTHAGFTHAFTKLFGLSPTTYRDRHDVRPFIRQLHEGRPTTDAETLARCPLTVTLLDVPDRTLAVMRFVGSTQQLPSIWPKMISWCDGHGLNREDSEFLGLHHDDWETTVADSYRYDAAVVVEEGFRPYGDVAIFRQSGGLVAMTAFEGSLLSLDRTWKQFTREWLPASGYQFRLSYVYDVYPADLVTGSLLQTVVRSLTGIRAKLCIPISRDWVDASSRDDLL